MTGKQLKEWAATVPDNAKIEMREKAYRSWYEDFTLRATTETSIESNAEEVNEKEEASA